MIGPSPPKLLVLDTHSGWVAVDKPAGLPTEPAPGFERCVLSELASELGVAQGSLHAVNRLDVVVSGVVLVVTDAASRQKAAELSREHRIVRRYLGLCSGDPLPSAGCWSQELGRVRGRHAPGGAAARPAATAYARVARSAAGGATLIAFEPRTGRTHQIRAHAAAAGHPLIFDGRYGGPRRLSLSGGRVLELDRIALHAARMTVPLPGGAWSVVAAVPPALRDLWARLGGEPEAWSAALEIPLPPCEAPSRKR